MGLWSGENCLLWRQVPGGCVDKPWGRRYNDRVSRWLTYCEPLFDMLKAKRMLSLKSTQWNEDRMLYALWHGAVSYTHLDVYKRQGLGCCQALG